MNSKNNKVGVISVIRSTIKNEGFFALYSGMRFDVVRVLPANTITFLVFEHCKAKFGKLLNVSKN